MYLSKASNYDYEIRTDGAIPSYFYFYVLDGAKVIKTYQFSKFMPRDVFFQMLDYCDAQGIDYMYLPVVSSLLPFGSYQLDLFASEEKPWNSYLLSCEEL